VAEQSNTMTTQQSHAALTARNTGSEPYLLGAALDWRRLGQIPGLGVRQSVVTKPSTVLRQGQFASFFF
jgi:hypothetical protein